MTLEEKDRQTLIAYRIEKAKNALEDARFLLENNKLHLAVNRIYYGIFYILSALALKNRFQTRKHQQLIGWFNKNYIKEGIIDKNFGQFVHKAYDERSQADYADYVEFDQEEVSAMMEDLKKLIQKIEELILHN
ncbi:MAG TPA: HEPN domain-containing protein [Candidatus Deferrimicrobium sp.]|nr:HEPN domain-containing protein [Candidatus Kapabacteria bacterium]HLP62637.1 HEPN domain-containing protein [Candidatus Deferrimicrobium sp.]